MQWLNRINVLKNIIHLWTLISDIIIQKYTSSDRKNGKLYFKNEYFTLLCVPNEQKKIL